MSRSSVNLLVWTMLSAACDDSRPAPASAPGGPGARCSVTADCAAGLQCVASGCVDPTTPAAQGAQAAAESLKFFESLKDSKVEATTNEVLMLRTVSEQFTLIRPGQCPRSMLDLKDAGVIARVEQDAWGAEYQFTCPGKHGPVDVTSFGPDRKPGGGDDITSAEAVVPAEDRR